VVLIARVSYFKRVFHGQEFRSVSFLVGILSNLVSILIRLTVANDVLICGHTLDSTLKIDSPKNEQRQPLSGKSFRFAIVASRWNDSLVSRLVDGALDALHEASVDDAAIVVHRVPGSFEIPLCALKAAASAKFDAIICLGVIIRGDTPHFDFVAAETARGITEVNLKTGVPTLFGVITANTPEQANARAGVKHDNKGYEAAMAAVEVVNLYREQFD
jgi:6,7-dimethyl-8-ribityllumazine synthase